MQPCPPSQPHPTCPNEAGRENPRRHGSPHIPPCRGKHSDAAHRRESPPRKSARGERSVAANRREAGGKSRGETPDFKFFHAVPAGDGPLRQQGSAANSIRAAPPERAAKKHSQANNVRAAIRPPAPRPAFIKPARRHKPPAPSRRPRHTKTGRRSPPQRAAPAGAFRFSGFSACGSTRLRGALRSRGADRSSSPRCAI